jgi:hypothetical protein
VPIQVGMMARVAACCGLSLEKGTLALLASTALRLAGLSQVFRTIVTNLLKFVPART